MRGSEQKPRIRRAETVKQTKDDEESEDVLLMKQQERLDLKNSGDFSRMQHRLPDFGSRMSFHV